MLSAVRNLQKFFKPTMIYRLSSGCSQNKFEGIEFQYPVPECRYCDVIKYLQDNFYFDEPLNKSLKISKKGEPVPVLDEYCMNTLKEGYSMIAVCEKNQEIKAALLNGIVRPRDLEEMGKKIHSISGKMKLIFEIIYSSTKKADLFCKYGVDEIFEFRIAQGARGLPVEMARRVETKARECGHKVILATCTGLYTTKAAEKIGFKKILEVKYACYKNDKGEVVFKPEPPHDALVIMTKELKDDCNTC